MHDPRSKRLELSRRRALMTFGGSAIAGLSLISGVRAIAAPIFTNYPFQLGVASGDVVATLIPNLPAQAEAHFGVPACGAVLNTINTRLEVYTVAYIFDHGAAKVVLVDSQFLDLAEAACAEMEGTPPKIIEVPDELSLIHI